MSPKPATKRLRTPLLLVLPLLALWACGYAQGYSARSLGIRSVSIRAVGNETYLQGIDQALSRRLGEDLTPMTGLVPARLGAADAVLEVDFLRAGGQTLIAGGQGSQREGSVWFECRARLVDARSGRILHESRHADRAEYRLAVGEDRASAYAESVADLSRKILISLGDAGSEDALPPPAPEDRRYLDQALDSADPRPGPDGG